MLRLCTLLLTTVATLGQIPTPSENTVTCTGSSCPGYFLPTATATFTARLSCDPRTGSFCQPSATKTMTATSTFTSKPQCNTATGAYCFPTQTSTFTARPSCQPNGAFCAAAQSTYTATRTSIPTRRLVATRTATASRTSRPTLTARPIYKTYEGNITRSIVSPIFVASPLPSRLPAVSPVLLLQPSPLPSINPLLKRNSTMPPMNIHRNNTGFIPTRLTLVGANPDRASSVENIQLLQSSMACALRIPIENVRIQSIIVKNRITGEKRIIPIDPRRFALQSNGTIQCLVKPPTTRRLQDPTMDDPYSSGTASINLDEDIEFDIAIEDPSEELSSLSTDEFDSVVMSSAIVQDAAAESGTLLLQTTVMASFSDFGSSNSTDIQPTNEPTPVPTFEEPSVSPVPSFNEELPSMSPRPIPSFNEELPSMSPRPIPSFNEELPSMSPIPSFDTVIPSFSPIPSFRDDPFLNLPPTVKDCLRRMISHMFNQTLPTGTTDPLTLLPLFLDENGTMPLEFEECFGTINPPPQPSVEPPCTTSDGSPCPSFPPRPSIDPSFPPPPPPQPSVEPPCTTSDGSPCPPPTFDPIVKECLQTVISNMFNESSIQSMDPFFALPMLFTNGTFPPEIKECFSLIQPPIQIEPSFTPLPSMRPEQLNIPASVRDCIVKLIVHRFNTTDPEIIRSYLHYAIYLHYNGTAPQQIEDCFETVTTMGTITARPEMPSMSSKPEAPSMSSRPTIQVLDQPSISSKPELPSQSVRPSMSSRPSRLPLRVSVNPIAAAVIEQVRQRLASLSPLPSPSKAAPPRISMARSPMPSPWFVRPSRSAAPSRNPDSLEPVEQPTQSPRPTLPPYIDNQLKIKGANPVELIKPEKIQELQASLACTLLMPLENIQIRSFSILFTNGTKIKLPIDPSEFRMSSGGEAGCFMPSRNSSRLLRNRRLQNSEGSVVVDYTIVEPPEEITTLSSDELTTVLASSDVLTSTVSSVGGLQISSEVAVDSAQAQPSQSPNTLSTTNSQTSSTTFGQMVTYIAAPVGTLLVISAVAFIGIKYYKEKNYKLQKELEKMKKDPTNPVQVLVRQADVFSNRTLTTVNNPVARGRKVPMFIDTSETYRVAMAPMTPGNKSQV